MTDTQMLHVRIASLEQQLAESRATLEGARDIVYRMQEAIQSLLGAAEDRDNVQFDIDDYGDRMTYFAFPVGVREYAEKVCADANRLLEDAE